MTTKLFTKRWNPFCGLYLQGLVRWGAIISLFGQIANVVHILVMVEHDYLPWQESYLKNPFNYNLRLLLWVMFGLHGVVTASLNLLVFKAANQKILNLLKIYIWGTAINLLMVQATFWLYTIYFCIGLPNRRFALVAADATVKLYLLYVVKCFIREVKEDRASATEFRDLTDHELYEFENGQEITSTSTDSLQLDIKSCMDRFKFAKYRKSEFEVSFLDMELDTRAPLGSGTFGTVYRAILSRKMDETIQKVPVAVKTTNPLSSNVEHFKTLLSELKVMTWIGNHKNIANYIGACTEDIKKRKLYIVLELCAFGNLQTYLRSQRGTFEDLTEEVSFRESSSISLAFNNDEEVTNTMDLVKWSKDIADGMDYLESRKIVHGDLAARNVLLTEHRIAKITDFGLSRQLYNYATYVKKKDVKRLPKLFTICIPLSQLPWRWLSLETILDMEFSTQSDIWSYGVTIWELFQLGETPWSGHRFCIDFIKDLKCNKRMDKPRYASPDMYKIMLSCWEEIPNNRPTFKKLSGDFHTILMQLNKGHCETTNFLDD